MPPTPRPTSESPSSRLHARAVALLMVLMAGGPPPIVADDLPRCVVSRCETWLSTYDGPGTSSDWDLARSLAVSPDGARVFVTGASEGIGDPDDCFTRAYDAATGAPLWSARYNGPALGSDAASAVAVSPDGARLFVIGNSAGLGTGFDCLTVAYDAATGQQLWTARYDGPISGDDVGFTVAVSLDGGQVFVGGYSEGSGLPSEARYDITTAAYDAATGQQLWIKRYDRGGKDVVRRLAVDPRGTRVAVVGFSEGATTGSDYVTLVYGAANGQEQWVSHYNGPANGADDAWSVAFAPGGARLYVTGWSTGTATGRDYATVAYDAATGDEAWIARSSGTGKDESNVVRVSPDGARVFVTGESNSTSGGQDYLTVAYDAATGAQSWESRFSGIGAQEDVARALEVSPGGSRLYVSGWSTATGAFQDMLTEAIDAETGLQLWTQRYNGPGNFIDAGQALGLSPDGGHLFACGYGTTPGGGSVDYLTFAYAITAAPSATLAASPSSGDFPLDVTFDLGGADSDGLVDGWSLDVDGDGVGDYGGSGAPPATVTHTYAAAGAFTARLTVSDDHGAVGRDDVSITVTDPNVEVPEPGAARPEFLLASFPNPIREATTVKFSLARADRLRLTVHDLRGGLVRTLARGESAAGSHAVTWDGRDARGRQVPAGVYVIRLEAGTLLRWRKVMVLR